MQSNSIQSISRHWSNSLVTVLVFISVTYNLLQPIWRWYIEPLFYWNPSKGQYHYFDKFQIGNIQNKKFLMPRNSFIVQRVYRLWFWKVNIVSMFSSKNLILLQAVLRDSKLKINDKMFWKIFPLVFDWRNAKRYLISLKILAMYWKPYF